jgi:hypothetical protein
MVLTSGILKLCSAGEVGDLAMGFRRLVDMANEK